MARNPRFIHPLRAVAQIIGKSQAQMAELLGISSETIKSVCLGRMAVSPELSDKIGFVTGAKIAPGRITVTRKPKDVFGRNYTAESFEHAKHEVAGNDWRRHKNELSASIAILMEAAQRKRKTKNVAIDVASALRELVRKHNLRGELGRMLSDVPQKSWMIKGRACDLRAVLRLNVAPCSLHDAENVRDARRKAVRGARLAGVEPVVDWNHPLTFDLRKGGGDAHEVVTIYGKANQSPEWAERLEQLPTLSGAASYCLKVRSAALRIKRSPV